jgi:hypothetical protein
MEACFGGLRVVVEYFPFLLSYSSVGMGLYIRPDVGLTGMYV